MDNKKINWMINENEQKQTFEEFLNDLSSEYEEIDEIFFENMLNYYL